MTEIRVGNKIVKDTGKSRYVIRCAIGSEPPSEKETAESEMAMLTASTINLRDQIQGLQQAMAELTILLAGGEA